MSRVRRTIFATVVALSIAAGCQPAPAPGRTVTVPATIDATGRTDVSRSFATFLARVPDGSTVTLKRGATYRMESTLVISRRSGLTIDGNGARILATTSGGLTRAHVRVIDSRNVRINDLIVEGANPDAGLADAAYRPDREHQHGFDIRSSSGVTLARVTVTDVYGDFVYIGLREDGAWSSDVTIRDSTFTRNGRQGVAVTAARNVVIERNRFDQVRRSTIDFEPHSAPVYGVDGAVVRDNSFGRGRLLLVAAAGAGPINNITISGNRSERPLDVQVGSSTGRAHWNWRVVDNVGATEAGNPHQSTMVFKDVVGLEVRGNHQPVQISRPMYGAVIVDSCAVTVAGNSFPGAVAPSLTTSQARPC